MIKGRKGGRIYFQFISDLIFSEIVLANIIRELMEYFRPFEVIISLHDQLSRVEIFERCVGERVLFWS